MKRLTDRQLHVSILALLITILTILIGIAYAMGGRDEKISGNAGDIHEIKNALKVNSEKLTEIYILLKVKEATDATNNIAKNHERIEKSSSTQHIIIPFRVYSAKVWDTLHLERGPFRRFYFNNKRAGATPAGHFRYSSNVRTRTKKEGKKLIFSMKKEK